MTPLSNERLAELIRGWHNVAALDAGAKDVLVALRELQSARERIAGLERDAKRYRWLKSVDAWCFSRPPMRAVTVHWTNRSHPNELDAALAAKGDTQGDGT